MLLVPGPVIPTRADVQRVQQQVHAEEDSVVHAMLQSWLQAIDHVGPEQQQPAAVQTEQTEQTQQAEQTGKLAWPLPPGPPGDLDAEVLTYRMARLGEPVGEMHQGWPRLLRHLPSQRVLDSARSLIKLHSVASKEQGSTRSKDLVHAAMALERLVESWQRLWTGLAFFKANAQSRTRMKDTLKAMEVQPSSFESVLLHDMLHQADSV